MRKLIFLFVTSLMGLLQAEVAPAPEVHPILILGGGVGALTSAIYLGRAGFFPVVIEGPVPGGAITQSHSVENWPGEMKINGLELIDKIRAQAEANGAIFLSQEVVAVDFTRRPFVIETRDVYDSEKKQTLLANSCIIAMGATPKRLGVPGEETYWSQGVYSCAVCDGSLFHDRVVAIVGGGDAAISEADYLSNIAKKVFILVRGDAFRTFEENTKNAVLSRPNVEVLYQTQVKQILGNGETVSQLRMQGPKGESLLDVDGVFLAIGASPNTEMFRKQLELDRSGYIVRKKDLQTSVEGVFAIGDISDPVYKQAITAAGDGAKAAIQAQTHLGQSKPRAMQTAKVEETKSVAPQGVLEMTSVAQFQSELRQTTVPVIVDFYATWCPPCQRFAPVFESFAKQLAGRYKFLKVNVADFDDLCSKYGVTSMPTVLVFDPSGKPIQKYVGTQEITPFLEKLKTSKQ